jgi:hypothetical protein
MKYIVGSGYHYRSTWDSEFFQLWKKNTEKYTKDYYVVCTKVPADCDNMILLNDNLGHVGDCIKENRDGLCGWSHSVLTLAMIAYGANKDLIFKESDCIWHGDVPSKLYEDCGDKGMVFGAKMTAAPWMACAQATFLIKHWCILEFIRDYLFLPSDKDMLPEDKFVKLEEQSPNTYGRISFGVDRQRPIPWDEPVWYAQQWTQEELDEAKRKGIV